MTLSDADIERYARQIVVPGIGAAGQARLLGATVLVDGVSHGVACARAYLQASGVAVVDTAGASDVDCVLVAGLDAVAPRLDELLELGKPLVWYEIDDGRLEAGVAMTSRELPRPAAATSRPRGTRSELIDRLLHQVAACDAVGTVVAVLLGWSTPELRYTKALG